MNIQCSAEEIVA